MPDTVSQLSDHIILCNWSQKALTLVRELHAPVVKGKRTIVVVTEHPEEVRKEQRGDFKNVLVVPGDPTVPEVLDQAGIRDAAVGIILADDTEGAHADAKSILIALAVTNMNPHLYLCAEVRDSKNKVHFERTAVQEIVCVDDLAERLLAQAALTHGVSEVFTQLLTISADTCEFYKITVGTGLAGKTYREVAKTVAENTMQDVILLGVETAAIRRDEYGELTNGHGRKLHGRLLTLNPSNRPRTLKGQELKTREYTLQEGDALLCLAYAEPDIANWA